MALFGSHQVVLVCNAVNAFLCGLPHLAGQKVVLNVDGIERQRKKWNGQGGWLTGSGSSSRPSCPTLSLLTRALFRQYYRQEYGFRARFIPYGAPVGRVETTGTLQRLRLTPGSTFFTSAAWSPKTTRDLVIEAYNRSGFESLSSSSATLLMPGLHRLSESRPPKDTRS